MDDVILFGCGTLEESNAYKDILDLFCSASGMCIRLEKSSFLSNNLQEVVSNNIKSIFPYKKELVDSGFTYLDFRLKPFGYGVKD